MKKLKKIILQSPDTVNVVSYDKPRFKKSIKVNDTIYISKMNYRDSDAYPYIYHNKEELFVKNYN